MEVLDGDVIRVATVVKLFCRVAMLIFDGSNRRMFFDKNSTDVFPIGWCEKTDGCLFTPYGPITFKNTVPIIGKQLKKM